MKKSLLLTVFLSLNTLSGSSQFLVSDFETFSLPADSFYVDTNSTPFSTVNASFQHRWSKAFSMWSGGFSYSNKYDSSTAGYTNLYGVKPYKGYNSSSTFVVGQNRGLITLASVQNTVDGFYLTNTTYAYKSMKSGDVFAKKFGGQSGNDPDFFKITIKGYKNGTMKTDSVEFYLADYRFSNNNLDYVLDTWQWVNTSSLGEIDSLRFFMYSSDVGQFGINTPLFFGLDNFTTKGIIQSVSESANTANFSVYPNPFDNVLRIELNSRSEPAEIKISDPAGKMIYKSRQDHLSRFELDLTELQPGLYFLEINCGEGTFIKKIMKSGLK